MLQYTKTLGIVQVDEAVRKKLSAVAKEEIASICDLKIEEYFAKYATKHSELLHDSVIIHEVT